MRLCCNVVMARWFNIGGPCNPTQNYMLPAMGRLPDVSSLLRKGQYFVVHAQRQCGKTTAFLTLANEINAKGDADLSKPWDGKISSEDVLADGKTIHLVCC